MPKCKIIGAPTKKAMVGKRRRRRRRGRRGETVSPLPEMRVAIMGWSEGSFLR